MHRGEEERNKELSMGGVCMSGQLPIGWLQPINTTF